MIVETGTSSRFRRKLVNRLFDLRQTITNCPEKNNKIFSDNVIPLVLNYVTEKNEKLAIKLVAIGLMVADDDSRAYYDSKKARQYLAILYMRYLSRNL